MSIPIVVGSLADHECMTITQAAARVEGTPIFFSSAGSARTALAETKDRVLRCVFVDEREPELDDFLAWLRGDGRLFSVPAIALVSRPVDQAYRRAHALGADDVVMRADEGGITRRLANLEGFDPRFRPPITQGRAVVAHHQERRRRVLGRILRQAGFDVSFAASATEVQPVANSGEAPSLVVMSVDLSEGDPLALAAEISSRASREGVPVILLAGDDHESVWRNRKDPVRMAVAAESAPPDNLLFLANELLHEEITNLRASARFLFGSICAFRRAGELTPAYGLTYNISREGLFVRTLDPPPVGQVLWFEMRPPGRPWAVHLRGTVVWSHGLLSSGGAAPPGFGIRIAESACPSEDLRSYQDSYDDLVKHPEISRS